MRPPKFFALPQAQVTMTSGRCLKHANNVCCSCAAFGNQAVAFTNQVISGIKRNGHSLLDMQCRHAIADVIIILDIIMDQ